MLGQVRETERLRIEDQQPENPVALGEAADRTSGLVVDADRDELRQLAAGGVQNPQRPVARVDQVTGQLGDALEHLRQVEVGAHRHDCVQKLAEALTTHRHPPTLGSPTRARSVLGHTGRMTIGVFLLDDHEIVRRGLRDLIDNEDDLTVVGEADTAEAALARIQATSPDVAVLDVRLPDGDGVQVCCARSARPSRTPRA